MKKIFLWVLLLTLITGCATAERWVRENPRTATGIAVGAATGGLAGGLIGHQVGHTAGGLLIGSGLGGATGGLIGGAVEDRGRTSGRSSSTPSAHYSRSPSPRYDPTVANLQKNLVSRGYDSGPIDGIMGPRTRLAIRRFQKDQGLPVDGLAGPATRAKMSI